MPPFWHPARRWCGEPECAHCAASVNRGQAETGERGRHCPHLPGEVSVTVNIVSSILGLITYRLLVHVYVTAFFNAYTLILIYQFDLYGQQPIRERVYLPTCIALSAGHPISFAGQCCIVGHDY